MNSGRKISTLKGIGEKTEKLFQKIGIYTVDDLIRYYPRRFEIFDDPVTVSELEEGKVCAVSGTVFGKIQVTGGKKRQITTMYLKDITGTVKVIWFNMPFLRSALRQAGLIILRGKIVRGKSGLVMEHPLIYNPSSKYEEKRNSLQPVYGLTQGLTNNMVIKAAAQALADTAFSVKDILPLSLSEKHAFPEFHNALKSMHFPISKEDYAKARNRFAYEEFLVFLLSLRLIKEKESRAKNRFHLDYRPEIDRFLSELPFELTGAQKKVWKQIVSDLCGEHVMSRLIQGDVGSGKTIIAFLALFSVGLNGYQGAFMTPTEVLAHQHYENITDMLRTYRIPLQAVLLTGSMTSKQKNDVYRKIDTGEASIIIGTHALIQDKVTYRDLALVITDEQHRFGVKQREALAGKGQMPHILVMSATPIPRTLAIILYGDLDISIMDELPKNRLPIKNCVVDTSYREKAYSFIKKQVKSGRQCYVICPMVEESENMEAENVTDYSYMLAEKMGSDIKIGCLHGRMKQSEKDEIMEAFDQNRIQILVSTTVIEVGIDVPNATVIMIENADRFGLAQLHQLRGRVGRGKYQSYCIFMTASGSRETKKRLEILNHSNDGFFIAEEDLKLRGPGDLFGIRQSGILDFGVADIFQDAALLRQASEDASELLMEDPKLQKKENKELGRYVAEKISRLTLEATL